MPAGPVRPRVSRLLFSVLVSILALAASASVRAAARPATGQALQPGGFV